MKPRVLATIFTMVFLAGFAMGQMRGSMGGGGTTSSMGNGQPSMGNMHAGSHSDMAGANQTGGMTPMQRRQLMHTTSMHDQKYQACAHAMSKVQGDLSRMQMYGGQGTSVNASSGDQQQTDDSSDSLSSDLTDLTQDNDELSASLNPDQQAVVARKLKDLDKKTKEMQALAQRLKSELDNAESDSKLAKEQTKKLNKLGKEIAKEQREIATALGITA